MDNNDYAHDLQNVNACLTPRCYKSPVPTLPMEHVARRLVQKMVLHPRRAEQDHAVRRGLHSGDEDELVGETRAPGTDPRNIWNDLVEKTRWSKRSWEFHQPTGLALPEESTS